MRKKFVAGNWKMHLTLDEALALAAGIMENFSTPPLADVLIAPPYPFIYPVAQKTAGSFMRTGAQNAHWADFGAFTGEVSVPMLLSAGAESVILGHSERRQSFGETNEILAKKVANALKHGLPVIYCVGENETQREKGDHFDTVRKQIKEVLQNYPPTAWKNITIAYEPVWAIGTGKTATPAQAQEMHAFIRELIASLTNDETAQNTRILYGGSVKPHNAFEIFSQPDVDGGLIGGASLKADAFSEIIRAADKTMG